MFEGADGAFVRIQHVNGVLFLRALSALKLQSLTVERVMGFEPTTFCLGSRYSSRWIFTCFLGLGSLGCDCPKTIIESHSWQVNYLPYDLDGCRDRPDVPAGELV